MSDKDNEKDRLAELRSYEILDTPRDGAFDDITRLAATFFSMPICIVSIVDTDRVWFKSAQGLGDLRQIDRGPGLCASAILQEDAYIAHDLRKDVNSLANPLVAQENGFRFYAAIPLRGKKGHALGTFCVIDMVPRAFSKEDTANLNRFARLVMAQMEQRLAGRQIAALAQKISEQNATLAHDVNHDALTGVFNRAAAEKHVKSLAREEADGDQVAMLILDVDHFKSINDRFGHAAGDAALKEVARRIKSQIRDKDMCARYGGEEFLVVLKNCPADVSAKVSERIRKCVEAEPILAEGSKINVTVSGGLCHSTIVRNPEAMIKSADNSLYSAKNSGRNKIVVAEAA